MRHFNRFLGAALVAAATALATSAWAKTELTMYYPVAVGGPLTKVVDGLVADFEKENPDIAVSAIYAGNYNDARIKALAALKSGDRAWLDSFYPALMENGRTQGKTWGIPFQRSTIVMYYNKDAFREAGLDPESPPATWDELVEAGKKLTKKSGDQVERWGAMIPSTGYPYWMFGALTKQNGQVLMNGDGNETYYDAAATVEALNYWVDLGNKHGVMPSGTIEWGTLRQNFLEQKTAIMWHSTGNLTAVKKNAAFDFGVAMLPAKKQRGTPTGGGNFYIFKKSTPEERTAAMKLIKFMTAPERTAEWSIKTGYIGTRPDAYETAKLKDYVVEFPPAAVARDQLEFATAELSTYQTGRVRKLLDDAIQAALTGSKSPEEALGAAQSQADRLLKRYR
jgi:sn-glycerol 3-phosphate transport system substrate-binding protein